MRISTLLRTAYAGLLLAAALCCGAASAAERISYSRAGYTLYNSSDGLPSERVFDIAESADGAIWLATDAGLCRFDGSGFRNFTFDGLSADPRVACICPDGAVLWLGTPSGLLRFDALNGTAEKPDIRAAGVPGVETEAIAGAESGSAVPETMGIRSMLLDGDGSLWMHLREGFVCRYHPETGIIEKAEFLIAMLEGDYRYDHVFKDASGRIWISGRAASVALVENGNLAGLRYPVRNPSVECFEGSAFASAPDGSLYACDDKGNFSLYDAADGVFRTVLEVPVAASCAVTDAEGRIWVGGASGLVRLLPDRSGFEWRARSAVNCLFADSRGNVWAGTDKGLALFEAYSDAVEHYGTGEGLSSDAVTALMQDRDSLLWIGTEEDGVDTLNLRSRGVGNLRYSLLSGRLDAATLGREKETLRQYAVHGLERSDAANDDGINENRVSALYQDSRGTIYIGLWSHVGFNTYDKAGGRFKRHCLWSVPAGYVFPLLLEGNLFGANWYTGFLEDSRGNMWCTTWEGVGLNLFDRDRGTFTGVHFIPGDVPRMPRGTICSNVIDGEGGMVYMAGGKWYGYFDLHSRKFFRYVEKFPEDYPNAAILDGYYAHSPARQIDIPVNTLDLRVLDKNGAWVLVASANSLFEHNVGTDEVRVLYRSQKFRIEYEVYDGSGRTYVRWDDECAGVERAGAEGFRASACGLPAGMRLREGGDTFNLGPDTLFVQTSSGSTLRLLREDRVENISLDAPRTLPSRLASCLVEDSDGYLWYGTTDSGLCRLDPVTGETAVWRDLPGSDVRDIYFSSRGALWAGTDRGLAVYDGSGDFIPAAALSGVPVRRILEDSGGRLWISSDRGLYCYNPESGEISGEYHSCDGLANEVYSPAACVLKDGRLAFGGMKGFDIIRPERMLAHGDFSLIVSDLRTADGILSVSVPETVHLRHKDNSFTVDFSSIGAAGHRRRYRLDGFEKEWNYSDDGTVSARYTNVPGGRYSLEMEALGSNGLWLGRSIALEVDPPLVLRWWFILLMLVLLTLAVLLVFRLRMRAFREENEKLSAMVDERTGELRRQIDSRNKFFSVVSHDLKNPVNSLDLLSGSLVDNWDRMSGDERLERIKVMKRASDGTLRLLDDILSWAKSASGAVVADKRTLNLRQEAEKSLCNVEIHARTKGVVLCDELPASINVIADPDMLAAVFRNLLTNAIKYSYRYGKVTLSAECRGGRAYVSIRDEGVGMSSETVSRLFSTETKSSRKGTEGEQGNGFGLVVVKEFLTRMGEDISVESIPRGGSCFTFSLRLEEK